MTYDGGCGDKDCPLCSSDFEESMRLRAITDRSKYGVRLDAAGKLRRTLNGKIYHSAAERDHAANLEVRQKCGEISRFAEQVPFHLRVPGSDKIIGIHFVDFLVYDKLGNVWVEEVKGHETALWKWKRAHFQAQYPEIPYKVIRAAVERHK